MADLGPLHDAMAARVDRGELPGIVLLVARGDDVTVDAIGVTRFGGDVPLRRDTPFRITSMTKPVLAAVTMMLVEDDVLDLEEPVQRLLPELAGRRVLVRPDGPLDETVPAHRPITVDDLLTFRLGFGMVGDPAVEGPLPVDLRAEELGLALGPPDPRARHDVDEWMRRFGTLPLIYQPGERWTYNVGSFLLGALVARAAGRPLGDVLRERLFDPLGMRETGFRLSADRARELPGQYSMDPETGRPVENTLTGPDVWVRTPAFPSGAGGLASTVDEYAVFARMLLNRGVHGGTRLLSEKSVDMMTTNHLTPEQITGGGFYLSGNGWGFGMAVSVRPDEVSAVPGRYGWSGGYGTSWFNDPHERLIGIALTQVSDFLWSGALTEFQKLAYRTTPGDET
jgi:CubicO group peptidase (beta-lactamase class C family)